MTPTSDPISPLVRSDVGQCLKYNQAEQYLDRLQMFTIKLGLEATRNLLNRLGNPHEQLRIFHIAGTNGKGSVGATLQAVLTAAG